MNRCRRPADAADGDNDAAGIIRLVAGAQRVSVLGGTRGGKRPAFARGDVEGGRLPPLRVLVVVGFLRLTQRSHHRLPCRDVRAVTVDDLGSGESESARNARSKSAGSVLRRLVARRRIPAAARGLKQYLGWAWATKACDNEDSTASLGRAEVLSVENTPHSAAPRSGCHTRASPSRSGSMDVGAHEGAQDECEVQALVGGESAIHVLPDRPLRAEGVPEAGEVPEQPGVISVESATDRVGGREIGTGRSGGENVDRFEIVGLECREVGMADHSRPMAREHPATERLRLALPADRAQTGAMQPAVKTADT